MGECTPYQFTRTMVEIVNYVVTTHKKYRSDFTMTLEDLELTDPIQPAAPDPSDHVAFEHCRSTTP